MWTFMLCYNNIVLKKNVLKYVSLDVTGSIIHLRMDQHFLDMSFTHSSVLSNIYFIAAG